VIVLDFDLRLRMTVENMVLQVLRFIITSLAYSAEIEIVNFEPLFANVGSVTT